MIIPLKIAVVTGIAAFLAYCVSGPPVKHYAYHSKKHHRKIIHEYYTPTPAPTPTSSPVYTPAPAVPTPKPDPTPRYRTSTHRNPPWSPNFIPDN